MLSAAGGLMLGFFGVVGAIFLLSMLLRTHATPDVFAGVREGFKAFVQEMKGPPRKR